MSPKENTDLLWGKQAHHAAGEHIAGLGFFVFQTHHPTWVSFIRGTQSLSAALIDHFTGNTKYRSTRPSFTFSDGGRPSFEEGA